MLAPANRRHERVGLRSPRRSRRRTPPAHRQRGGCYRDHRQREGGSDRLHVLHAQSIQRAIWASTSALLRGGGAGGEFSPESSSRSAGRDALQPVHGHPGALVVAGMRRGQAAARGPRPRPEQSSQVPPRSRRRRPTPSWSIVTGAIATSSGAAGARPSRTTKSMSPRSSVVPNAGIDWPAISTARTHRAPAPRSHRRPRSRRRRHPSAPHLRSRLRHPMSHPHVPGRRRWT